MMLARGVRVSLVGAGPGDPELLTLRAVKRLQAADVVMYDALVDEAVLSFCKATCEFVNVGKRARAHSWEQSEINRYLVLEASRGKYVVRLKGGDPFVFGRGGEEALALAANGIAFEVVPGVSSAVAAAGAALIPVTHRGVATHFTVMTGSSAQDLDGLSEKWEQLARAGGTLIFLMPVAQLEVICARLQAAGLSPACPAALVQGATTDKQRVLVADLRSLPERALSAGIGTPATLIVGEVVALREALTSFNDITLQYLETAQDLRAFI